MSFLSPSYSHLHLQFLGQLHFQPFKLSLLVSIRGVPTALLVSEFTNRAMRVFIQVERLAIRRESPLLAPRDSRRSDSSRDSNNPDPYSRLRLHRWRPRGVTGDAVPKQSWF